MTENDCTRTRNAITTSQNVDLKPRRRCPSGRTTNGDQHISVADGWSASPYAKRCGSNSVVMDMGHGTAAWKATGRGTNEVLDLRGTEQTEGRTKYAISIRLTRGIVRVVAPGTDRSVAGRALAACARLSGA